MRLNYNTLKKYAAYKSFSESICRFLFTIIAAVAVPAIITVAANAPVE